MLGLGPGKRKYLDTERFQREARSDALAIRLDELPEKTILDVGTGPGHFPIVCREMGHTCFCMDKEGKFFEGLRKQNGMEMLGEHYIEPMVPFPKLRMDFDIVTLFRVPFNLVLSEQRLFSIPEWEFFLDDVRDNLLKPRGRLVLKLQKHFNVAGLTAKSPELIDLFMSRGAIELRECVFDFDPLL